MSGEHVPFIHLKNICACSWQISESKHHGKIESATCILLEEDFSNFFRDNVSKRFKIGHFFKGKLVYKCRTFKIDANIPRCGCPCKFTVKEDQHAKINIQKHLKWHHKNYDLQQTLATNDRKVIVLYNQKRTQLTDTSQRLRCNHLFSETAQVIYPEKSAELIRPDAFVHLCHIEE